MAEELDGCGHHVVVRNRKEGGLGVHRNIPYQPLLFLLIYTFSVLCLQLKKLRWYNLFIYDLLTGIRKNPIVSRPYKRPHNILVRYGVKYSKQSHKTHTIITKQRMTARC